jgi:hypothetical protein
MKNIEELSIYGQKMLSMDHIVNLGFPISRNDFPVVDWELYRLWRSFVQEEMDERERLRQDENKLRSKAGQAQKPRERY